MARGSGAGPRAASTVYRLPTEGDHPATWTIAATIVAGLGGFVYAVGDRRGFGLPVPVGVGVGAVAALITLVAYGLWIRRVPRGQALRVGPEGLTFTQGRTERWSIPWEAVVSAGIVTTPMASFDREPGPDYLRLELADGCAPDEPSLHPHEGAWWFPLSGFDTAARLHHDLARRIPGRARRAQAEVSVPRSMAGREAPRRR